MLRAGCCYVVVYLIVVNFVAVVVFTMKNLDIMFYNLWFCSAAVGAAAGPDSDDDNSTDDDPYEELLHAHDAGSSDLSDENSNTEPDLSILNTGKALVKNSLLQNYWRRYTYTSIVADW